MKLGKVAQINIGVGNLERSLQFYTGLGFQVFEKSNKPYPWARISDGQNLLLLNQDGNKFIGLIYFSKDAGRRIAILEKIGIRFVQRRERDGRLKMAVFTGPGGLVVGLNSHDPEGMPLPTGRPITKCGTFGEFAIPVDDFHEAMEFWQRLGFTALYESNEPYPWGILGDERIILGLHENKNYGNEIHFERPALTYFDPDMAERIELLKESGIIFDQELELAEGLVNNATLRGPDNELIFLFEGEI